VIVKLPYAADTLAVDLRGLRVRPLAPAAPPGAPDLPRLVGRALDRPLGGPPLVELARGRPDATVVVPDATRSIELAEVLPAVLERLARAGVPDRRVSVLVACGTHPALDDGSLASLVGAVASGIRVVQHDARDEAALVNVSSFADGTALRLHRLAAEASLLVTVGGVRHHYFAGFGGGPKMVFPGVAGYREIQANHARVLRRRDGELERDPGCQPGVLDGNPVAEEIARAADVRPPDCALCLVPGCDGRPAFAAAGPWRLGFAAAVERARSWYEVSGGRFPWPWRRQVARGRVRSRATRAWTRRAGSSRKAGRCYLRPTCHRAAGQPTWSRSSPTPGRRRSCSAWPSSGSSMGTPRCGWSA
jgi:hypothetical protein